MREKIGVVQGAGLNPYPPQIVDESSGIEVPGQRHQDWQAGFDTHASLMKLLTEELMHMAHEMDIALQDVRQMKQELKEKIE